MNRATEKKHGFHGEARGWKTKRADRAYQRKLPRSLAIESPRRRIRCKRTSYRRGTTILESPSRWIRAFSRESHANGWRIAGMCLHDGMAVRAASSYTANRKNANRGAILSHLASVKLPSSEASPSLSHSLTPFPGSSRFSRTNAK
jgi:hypothetical protein